MRGIELVELGEDDIARAFTLLAERLRDKAARRQGPEEALEETASTSGAPLPTTASPRASTVSVTNNYPFSRTGFGLGAHARTLLEVDCRWRQSHIEEHDG